MVLGTPFHCHSLLTKWSMSLKKSMVTCLSIKSKVVSTRIHLSKECKRGFKSICSFFILYLFLAKVTFTDMSYQLTVNRRGLHIQDTMSTFAPLPQQKVPCAVGFLRRSRLCQSLQSEPWMEPPSPVGFEDLGYSKLVGGFNPFETY